MKELTPFARWLARHPRLLPLCLVGIAPPYFAAYILPAAQQGWREGKAAWREDMDAVRRLSKRSDT